jgi:Carboxypeptidase regulatory-like domain
MQLRLAGLFLICTLAAFAQGDRGTITGTVTDPTGAVVPNANIQITNSDTSAVYKVATTNTGNYTLPNLPAGTYVLTVESQGFKKFERPNLVVQVAETVRVDAILEVGASTDTISVTAEAPLLKTESGEISHQVDFTAADQLPLFTTNGTGTSTMGNIRDPLTVLNIQPGAQQTTDTVLRVNGLPSSSQTIMVEGMDATNGMWRQQNQSTQQGVDAVQEVSVQTSNFAAEYGGAGGGYLNFTMRSGTNQYHGSAYDYWVNPILDAGLPFTANCNQTGNCATDPNSGHIKNDIRRNDYGFTLGGPVWIPKVYNGKDKTFFFFNFEQFRQTTVTNNGLATVPTPQYQTGNFAAAENFGPFPIPGLNGISPVGQIFDPSTRHTVNGGIVESPFPGNAIPISRLDPVALYLQSLFPQPNLPAAGVLNNYAIPAYSNFQHTTIPSVKIDQILNAKMKLSGYFSETETNSPETNGFNSNFAPVAPDRDRSYTYRLNFDDTLTPTLLFHFGVGLLYFDHPEFTPPSDFDAQAAKVAAAGFGGAPGGYNFAAFPANTYMPSFGGLTNTINLAGGLALGTGFFAPTPGPAGFDESDLKDVKPTANTSITWVRGNHTFKAGADMVLEGFPQTSSIRAYGEYEFSNQQTENPAEYGVGGIIFPSGFAYASFLLGQVSSVETSAINDSRLGNHTWGAFIQDSWKVNRRLTLELGLRWDYATLLQEEHGRMSDADFQGINPTLASPEFPNGRAGSIIYGATNGGQPLSNAYPFSLGPHVGVAYQINSKTVFRAGGSIAYSSSPDNAFLSYSVANFYTVASPGQFLPAAQLANGSVLSGPLTPTFPEYNQYPFPTSSNGSACGLAATQACIPPQEPFITIEKSSGRLPRVFQWSIGFQREILPNLMIDANYVGNRGAWFTAPLLDTEAFNGLTQNILSNLTTEGPGGTALYGAKSNMAFTNPSDYTLLNTPISSPAVIARFPLLSNPSNVYPGFPVSETLAQALRPYPQWFGVPPFLGPPMGDTWYDSLQVKVTKRYSHGLTAQIAYTFSKSLTNAANSNTSYLTPSDPVLNDPYNTPTIKQLSGFDQPQVLVISFTYTTPKIGAEALGNNFAGRAVSWLARDWTIGGVLKYASGALIQSPASNITLWNTMGIGGTPLNGVSNFSGGGASTEPLENYVPGQSCLAINPNSHFDPTKTLALNPAAWSNQTTETFGDSAPYYSNCRWQRQPAESLSLGRIFRIREKIQLLIQAQFFNVFNRVQYPAPAGATTSTTAATFGNPFPGSAAAAGALNAGYGFVNTLNGNMANPRSGQLVARFTF